MPVNIFIQTLASRHTSRTACRGTGWAGARGVVLTLETMLQLFCDFDGTITNRDSIVFLTERFGGGPRFRMQVLEAIKRGEITVSRAIEMELETISVPWATARAALLEEIEMRPSFPSFALWCQDQGIPLTVVSSGLRPVVELFLDGLEVPWIAHRVEMLPDGWRYRRDEAADKVAVLKRAAGQGRIAYVGDGTSDVEVIPHADFLFARSYLADYCRAHGHPFTPFETFTEIRASLESLLAEIARTEDTVAPSD